jgi:capsular exopolysaccharide synthesis family protein
MSTDLPVHHTSVTDPQGYGELYHASPAAQAAHGKGLGNYLSAIRRYKWLALALTLLGIGGGLLASRFAKPSYVAEVTVWIESNQNREDSGPIQSGNLLESTSWIDLIRSYAVLDSAVRQERLYLAYPPGHRAVMSDFRLSDRFRPGSYRLDVSESGKHFELKTADGVAIESGKVGDPIGAKLGFYWAPKPTALAHVRSIEFSVTTPRDAARRLNETLQIRMAREANFLRMEYKDNDPERVAAVLNAVAERYIGVAAELKRAKVKELVEHLESQRQYAERNLRDAEMALEGFRVQTITLPSDDITPLAPGLELTRDPVFRNFFELKIEREQLQRDAQGIRAALPTASDASLQIDAFARIPSVANSPELARSLADLTTKRAELRTLLQQYTPEHRSAQRLITEVKGFEQQIIPGLSTALLSQIRDRLAVLDQWIQSAGTDLKQIPPRVIEEARLRRQVEIAGRLHTDLRERYEGARLAAATTTPDVRILDRATVPQDAVENNSIRFVLFGLAAGLVLAIAVSLLLDKLDGRVRYPEHVSQDMGLPILGALPDLKTRSRHQSEIKTAQAMEALREVKLNLGHAFAVGAPIVLTVSSPGSGDGKTFVCCNLALAFADAGLKTLVVDGDTRRGTLHRMFQTTRRPGLTDYLTGNVSSVDIVQRTVSPLLDFIGCGSRMQSAPTFLGGERMSTLLRDLAPRYDVLLMDSPPLAAGADAYLLAVSTGNLLMVVRTGKTDRLLTEAKLSALDRLPVRLLGAVLNGIDETAAYKYYSYLEGYQLNADDESELVVASANQ